MAKKRKNLFQKLWAKRRPQVIIFVTIVISIVLTLGYLALSRPSLTERLSLTYLDSLSEKKLGYSIPDSYENTYPISDTTFYGENLLLYKDEVQFDKTDPLFGKNFMLTNLETGQELQYSFSGGADSGIDLSTLDPGVYEVFVVDEYIPKRVYTEKPFHSEVFTTMRRDRKVSNINLDASSEYLSKFGVQSDKNYLYLTVTESIPKVKVTDVIIDPSAFEADLQGTWSSGYDEDGFSESINSYELAEMVKSRLEAYGLKVEISRDENEPKSYYGAGSRVAKGYDAQAKVFLTLGMSAGDENRPYFLISPYIEGYLANAMAGALEEDGVELANVFNYTQNDKGVGYDTLMTDDAYQYTAWSLFPQLRETGGKATFAGSGTQFMANSTYADGPGMYGVIFFYASDESKDSQAYYTAHKDAIADGLAQGIISYFHIPKPEELEKKEAARQKEEPQNNQEETQE